MNRNVLLKVEKWVLWLAMIAIVVLLHDLLPLIFLTFVISYIGNSLVNLLGTRIRPRRLSVAIVFSFLLLVIAGAAVLLVPRIFKEARQLAVAYVAQDAGKLVGPKPLEEEPLIDRQTRKYVDTVLVQLLGRQSFESYATSESYEALLEKVEASVRKFIPKVVAGVREFANSSLMVALQFFVSIILAFLIVWDFPALKASVRSLSTGRTAAIYEEIAPGVEAFGAILGRAFEAQTGIAFVNAILTAVGFALLGIPSIALLTAIVFFCSYVPVVGVFLSTLPAALFAFQAGGITLVLWLVVMVLVVHAVEAYALNPLIYGRHMKMHPVAVIAILMVGEHLFGIWGLILGVPVSAFVRTYVMQWGGKATS
jgi:predicted PurR-regulated permease PerM